MRTQVCITIDTEFGIGGAFADPDACRPIGERNVTCEVGDWAPEQLRVVCPMDQNLAEGTAVSYQLP